MDLDRVNLAFTLTRVELWYTPADCLWCSILADGTSYVVASVITAGSYRIIRHVDCMT